MNVGDIVSLDEAAYPQFRGKLAIILYRWRWRNDDCMERYIIMVDGGVWPYSIGVVHIYSMCGIIQKEIKECQSEIRRES